MDYMDWELIKTLIYQKYDSIELFSDEAGIKYRTFVGWMQKKRMPRADEALLIARELDTTVEYLLTGENKTIGKNMSGLILRDDTGLERQLDGDLCLIPVLSQKAAAGRGQAMIDNIEIVGELPFLTRMLRGAKPRGAKAIEVRGDSMTGVNLFDGDIVIFVPGELRGDGIYVLRVGDELIVKRVEFDTISKRLRIMSENPRYPDRVESADSENVEVLGKVFGWVHAHPY